MLYSKYNEILKIIEAIHANIGNRTTDMNEILQVWIGPTRDKQFLPGQVTLELLEGTIGKLVFQYMFPVIIYNCACDLVCVQQFSSEII